MKYFVDGKEVTIKELQQLCDDGDFIVELWDIKDSDKMFFELTNYGFQE